MSHITTTATTTAAPVIFVCSHALTTMMTVAIASNSVGKPGSLGQNNEVLLPPLI